MEWYLTPDEFKLTEAKIAKVNERATKKGFTGKLELTGEKLEKTRDVSGFTVTEIVYRTTITGEAPCYNGWTFLAALDWTESGGLIVRTAPGIDTINRDGIEYGKCDHCHVNRYRKTSYVISNGERQLQVGSSCIKDFLGWNALPVFLSESDVSEEISGTCGSGLRTFTTDTVLAVVWACVTQFGFVRSMEPGSTRDAAMDVLDPFNKHSRELAERIRPLAKDAAPMAVKLREWVLSSDFGGDTEYVHNLKVLCAEDTVTFKHFGLLASVPQAYARWQEKTFIREREKANTVNEWLGKPKDKLTLNVRIKAVRFIHGEYGTTTLYKMVTDTGHMVEWFSSNGAFGDDETEEFFTINGTVKKLGEFGGQKSTVLTRCRKAK
jgi:hypothetical protein